MSPTFWASIVVSWMLAACTGSGDDTTGQDDTAKDSPPAQTACECEHPTDAPLTISDQGGFDDWSGAALGWAVDGPASRVLVVAMRYQTGVSTINMEGACEDPSALGDSWYPGIPESAAGAAAQYPLLGAALLTAAGVRSLTEDLGALLVIGDLSSTTPDQIYVLSGGTVTLLRSDAPGDTLQGALIFSAQAEQIGGEATVGCDQAIRLPALDFSWPSGGSD